MTNDVKNLAAELYARMVLQVVGKQKAHLAEEAIEAAKVFYATVAEQSPKSKSKN